MTVHGFQEATEYVPEIGPLPFDPQTPMARPRGFEHNRRVMSRAITGQGKSTHIEQIARASTGLDDRVNSTAMSDASTDGRARMRSVLNATPNCTDTIDAASSITE